MAFEAQILTLVGLLKLELPTTTVRLSDGGFCDYAGERYTSSHEVFGSIGGLEPVLEGVGDLAPGGSITFLPPNGVVATALSSPGFQSARLRGWLGEIGSDGKTVETARPLFDGLVDTTAVRIARGRLSVVVTFISRVERLFSTNEGNTLSSRFHKTIWPGELGFDNATGVQTSAAWGIDGPMRGASFVGSSGNGGGGRATQFEQAVQYQ